MVKTRSNSVWLGGQNDNTSDIGEEGVHIVGQAKMN